MLQAFQDWLVENNASDPYDKTRIRLMLLIPGTGSTFVPLQERYRAWLGDLAGGWGLFWLIQIRTKMSDKGLNLLRPPRTSEVYLWSSIIPPRGPSKGRGRGAKKNGEAAGFADPD